MNEIQIQYKDLLTMEFALRDSLHLARRDITRLEKTFEPESCLHKHARNHERDLIDSIEICDKLSKYGLYTHTDRK